MNGTASDALGAAWSGAQVGATPEMAISTTCTLESFGIGSLWLAKGLMAGYPLPAMVAVATARAAATRMA